MISVLTPSIRPEGLALVEKSLKRQTFEDFEWLIGSSFDPQIPWAKWVKDDFQGGFWTLNRMYNRLFQEAHGELIVSNQDHIYTPPTSLESFWDSYMAVGGLSLISGVGDQYKTLSALGAPVNKIWEDPRKSAKGNSSFYECLWNDCEWNWAAIPRDFFFQIGGMDEGLDFLGYGGDQLQFCDRANEYGAKFYLDRANESYTVRHDRSAHGGQEHWDANHILFNGLYIERKKQLTKVNQWPLLVDFGRDISYLEIERKVK